MVAGILSGPTRSGGATGRGTPMVSFRPEDIRFLLGTGCAASLMEALSAAGLLPVLLPAGPCPEASSI